MEIKLNTCFNQGITNKTTNLMSLPLIYSIQFTGPYTLVGPRALIDCHH